MNTLKTSTTVKHISDEQNWISTPSDQNCQAEISLFYDYFPIFYYLNIYGYLENNHPFVDKEKAPGCIPVQGLLKHIPMRDKNHP